MALDLAQQPLVDGVKGGALNTPLVDLDISDPEAPAEAADGVVADHPATLNQPPLTSLSPDIAPDVPSATATEPSPLDLPSLEALLFSTPTPLTAARLADLLGLDSVKPIRQAMAELNRQYEASARPFRAEQIAGGYQLLTLPVFGPLLQKLHQREVDAKLTSAALETLALVAYKQPIVRADIEAIRGVASGETLRSLMEKHLVKIAGRAEVPGRPILYGTTKRFLDVFGLNSLKDLPKDEQLPAPKKSATLAPKEDTADNAADDAAMVATPTTAEHAPSATLQAAPQIFPEASQPE